MDEIKIDNLEFQKLRLWLNFWKIFTRLVFTLIAIIFLSFYLSDKYFKIVELEYQLAFKKQENLSYYLKYASQYKNGISPSTLSSFVSQELNALSQGNVQQNTKNILPNMDNLTVSGDKNQGMASFYADKFQGKPTASGEAFDNNAFTAAHRTFPFGTMLKVTNVKTGQSVVVKVNDRGPFHKDRLIDISKSAAQKIGIVQAGVGEVTIEKVVIN